MKKGRVILSVLITVLGLLIIANAEGVESSRQRNVPSYFAKEYSEQINVKAIRKSVERNLALIREKFPSIESKIKASQVKKYFLSACMKDRLNIVRGLIKNIEVDINRGDNISLIYANQQSSELSMLVKSLEKEISLYEKNLSNKMSAEEKLINVKDFGARGDGLHNDSAAFQKALEKARELGSGAEVFIPKGHYILGDIIHLKASIIDTISSKKHRFPFKGWGRAHIFIYNMSNFTFEGEKGTVLIMKNPRIDGIVLVGSENVIVKNIAIDYDPLPFSQGTVIAVNENEKTFDWKKDDGYPDPTRDYFLKSLGRMGSFFDAKTGRRDTEAGDKFIGKIKRIGPNIFRFEVSRMLGMGGPMYGIAVGEKFVMPARADSSGIAFAVIDSSYCVIDRVTIYSAFLMAYALTDDDAIKILNSVVEPLPGSNRLISTDADGLDAVVNRIGPYVANSRFSRMNDDGINVTTIAYPIYKINNPKEFLFPGAPFIRSGDRIAVLSPSNGVIKGEAKIVKTGHGKWQGKDVFKIMLDRPIQNAVSMEKISGKTLSRAEWFKYVTGAKQIKKRADVLMDLDAVGIGTVVKNNIFSEHRNVGIKIQSADALIEDNTIENLPVGGIKLTAMLKWNEPFPPHNIIIRNNTLENMLYGIFTTYILDNLKPADVRPIRNIKIENNIIQNMKLWGIKINNATEVEIIKNKYFFNGKKKSLRSKGIVIKNAANVVIDKNVIQSE